MSTSTPAAEDGDALAARGARGGSSHGCTARLPSGGLRRTALNKTLDAGLGMWLRGVDLDPWLVQGHFDGWVIRSLYREDPCFQDLDLHDGDVVTSVNGKPIERPEQAQAVWASLRHANMVVVEYRRNGVRRRLEIPIVDTRAGTEPAPDTGPDSRLSSR